MMSDETVETAVPLMGDKNVETVLPPPISYENPNIQLPIVKLDNNNYLDWSRSMKLILRSRGKLGLGNMTTNETGDLRSAGVFQVLDVGCGVASFSAYLLPMDIQTMSFAPKDVHENQIQFALERGIGAMISGLATKQLPFPSNSFEMPSTPDDITSYSKFVNQFRVYDFLAGRKAEYDPIRVQVLGRIPFPTLEQAFSYVHTEETRRAAMMSTPTVERSALQAVGSNSSTASESSASTAAAPAREPIKCGESVSEDVLTIEPPLQSVYNESVPIPSTPSPPFASGGEVPVQEETIPDDVIDIPTQGEQTPVQKTISDFQWRINESNLQTYTRKQKQL
ncbi:probable methyltransferase PMT21 [Telopea speciosissima]|uniref:probable methyltransferase PMT21 n=1 Tax=Telopea speciosissima TaxID=54955 RepID=UPI001CC61160|nr:probable methyltransferase PMT21 [Telopea speciosissima]